MGRAVSILECLTFCGDLTAKGGLPCHAHGGKAQKVIVRTRANGLHRISRRGVKPAIQRVCTTGAGRNIGGCTRTQRDRSTKGRQSKTCHLCSPKGAALHGSLPVYNSTSWPKSGRHLPKRRHPFRALYSARKHEGQVPMQGKPKVPFCWCV